MESFEDISAVLPEYVFTSLLASGIEAPMPIQAQALPIVLCGHDLVGVAKTGSGKTLAYLLPALAQIEAQDKIVTRSGGMPIVVVLAPVRELAVQIAAEAEKIVT